MARNILTFAGVLACSLAAGPALAATDPVGDFLATYTGTQTPNLDIIGVDARFDGANFKLSATMNGPIGATPGALYVWGVNRGAGTPRLNFIAAPPLDPTVLWDALAVQFTDGTLRVVEFPAVGAPIITPIAGGATINGATITTNVPLSLWPTRGFAPTSYTFQLWTRLRANPAADGTNVEIADFSPRVFAAVPEPASWAMMITGFGLAGWAVRSRRQAVALA
jgi:hypothetical protein